MSVQTLDTAITYLAIGLPLLTLLANFALASRLRTESEHQASSRNLQRVCLAFLVVCGALYLGAIAIQEIVLMMGAILQLL